MRAIVFGMTLNFDELKSIVIAQVHVVVDPQLLGCPNTRGLCLVNTRHGERRTLNEYGVPEHKQGLIALRDRSVLILLHEIGHWLAWTNDNIVPAWIMWGRRYSCPRSEWMADMYAFQTLLEHHDKADFLSHIPSQDSWHNRVRAVLSWPHPRDHQPPDMQEDPSIYPDFLSPDKWVVSEKEYARLTELAMKLIA